MLLRIQKSRQIQVANATKSGAPKETSCSTDNEDDTEFLSDSDHSTSAKDDSGIDLQLNADVDPNYPDDADNYPDDADNYPDDSDNSNDNISDSQETTDIDVKKALLEMKDMMKSLCDKVKTNEKSLKEIKDMYQRSDMYQPYV